VTPSTRVAIRAASTLDAEAIGALHRASWQAAYRGIVSDEFLDGITLESRIVRWRQLLSSSESPLSETIVAVDGDTIVGVCRSGPRRQPEAGGIGEVYALHVEPGSWRHGIGTMLLDETLRRLAGRGFTGAVLWVLRDNWNARHFYEAQGWSATGEEVVDDRSGYAIPETRYAITLTA
jgi:ribosomal protein S18 acetylase RimI-like enzyme